MPSTKNLINPQLLAYYLTYQFVPKPFHLSLHRQQETTLNFPHKPGKPFLKNEKWIAKNLHARLNNIIATTLEQTARPVGLLLSGGIDSTILLHLLRKNTKRQIHTITGAYASDTAHLKLCRLLARKYKTIHEECIIYPKDLQKLPGLYSKRLNNPIGDNGFLATHLMLKRLSLATDIIYTGDGADCLFHGLRSHYLDFIDENSPHTPRTMATQKRLSSKLSHPDYGHYKYGEIFFTRQEALKYLNINVDLRKPLMVIKKKIRTVDPIKRKILLDLNFLVVNRVDYILNAIDTKKTKIILPYLDPNLVDLALRIPGRYFIKDLEQKYILKKAFSDDLPHGIIVQKKRGMSPPFLEWYAINKPFVLKTLRQAPALGISEEYIHHLISTINHSSDYINGMRIWLVINLVLWYDKQQNILDLRP
jgi:asparagine synthase (glutamine-hydrolysing)